MRGGRFYLFAVTALLGCTAAALFMLRMDRPGASAATFVGSDACAGCHQQAYADWQQSHHHLAMRPANAATVLGDFADASFEQAGVTSRFFTRDGEYFVETDDAAGSLQTFRIAFTFGVEPLQQYLVAFPDGRMQALGLAWDSRSQESGGQRWYHLYPDEDVSHEDALHWTGAFQNWNSRCASCHSTNLEKGYSPDQDRYNTTWSEVSVGCEACHGPASRHLEWTSNQRTRDAGNKGFLTDLRATWTPPAGASAGARELTRALGAGAAATSPAMSAQLQVCSACHARRTELQARDATRSFLDDHALAPLSEGMYHPDGQMLDEVFETGSFLQSRMFQSHVSCTNCHEPHGARLRATGNALCRQCHEPQLDSREHTLHESGSAGAACVACHMPSRTYMGVDARHDHSFRIPDPQASLDLGVPNACTQCHRDRSDEWAASVLRARTGRTQPHYAHASLIADARRHDAGIAPQLLAYAAAPANPAILRATALVESARFPSQQQVDAVAAALVDTDPLVRAAAASALGFLDGTQRLAGLTTLLEDDVKSVRLAAARALADIRVQQAPAAQQPKLQELFAEYRASLLHNADMPESLNELGLFLTAQGDATGAEQAFLQARRLAPRYLPAMLNLSDAYRARGRDDLGETLLQEALRAYPESGDAHYMLGLLHVRTGRTGESVALFQRAMALAPGNPRYALVHAVSLAQTGRRTEAIGALEQAAARFASDAQIRRTLESYRASPPAR